MTNTTCVHCGENCGKYPVVWNNKEFCCQGCKTVYQLLNEHSLYSYYDIEKTPGVKIEKPDFENKYAYLDNKEINDKLIEFTDGEISKITLYIPSIHCSSCIWLLENLNSLHQGIRHTLVNFVKKEVSISYHENEITLREIVELLASIHYVPQITLQQFDQKKSQKKNRQLVGKIGIAGFAFGNIMLFSMPHYIPGKELIEEPFKNFFSYISLFLSLPVLIYCANDYFLSAFKNLKHKIINIDLPIALGVLALFMQSAIEIIGKTGSGYLDSLSGLVFFLLIGKWFQSKTYEALSFERDYKSYFPVAVTRIKDGKEESIQLEELKEKDRILIRNQELIPADSVLVKGLAYIDYSFVTGESRAVSREVGMEVFAGGKQIGSSIELEVNKEVQQSQLTKLWNQENTKEQKTSALVLLVDKVSQYFTLIIISIAVLTAVIWLFIDPSKAISIATAVLIIACPCALALSVPFTFGNSMRLLGKAKFYIKKTDVIEKLTKVDTLVFDKTGTLTKHGAEKVEFVGDQLTEEESIYIYSISRHSTHPLSYSISQYLNSNSTNAVIDFMEIPASGLKGVVNNHKIKLGSYAFVSGNNEFIEARAASKVYVSIDGQIKGFFNIENDYRYGLPEIINQLSKKYELHVISGDNDSERDSLQKIFPTNNYLNFNMSPEDKLKYIQDLNAQGKKIMMIGDGLNDAGALRESLVGISIADDVYQFSPACDAILDASNFHLLNELIELAKKSVSIVNLSFALSFLYNIIGLSVAVQGLLSPIFAAILMPLSSISVVIFTSISTRWIFNKSKLAP